MPGNEGFPDQGPKIPHAKQQLSPCATTRGTACWNDQVFASQLVHHNKRSHTMQCRSWVMQLRPDTVKLKKKKQLPLTEYYDVSRLCLNSTGSLSLNPAKILNVRYFYLLFLDKETEFGKVKLLSQSYNLEMEIRIWTLFWVFRTCCYTINFKNNLYLDEIVSSLKELLVWTYK